MKKITLLTFVLFSLISLSAQQKPDSVYMLNNEVKVGAIKSIDDESITFVHQGETLIYTFKKSNISKIVFSSGRVENIHASTSAAANMGNNADNNANVDHHNKVAILPFGYIDVQQQVNIEMGYKVQDECYNYLSSKSASLTIQDPSNTNALLGKAGVTFENVRNFTNADLCNILGVEYLMRGTITTNATTTTSSGSASYNENDKSGSSQKDGSSNSKSSGNLYTSTTSQQNYRTSVLMEVYMDDGKKVFSQDRTSFWTSVDAYKNTIQYLLKKSPVYGR